MKIDINKFCYSENGASEVPVPFFLDGKTYATNMYVIVCIKGRRRGVRNLGSTSLNKKKIKRYGVYPRNKKLITPPPLKMKKWRDQRVGIFKSVFNAVYIKLICDLPNLRFVASDGAHSPLKFVFDGGSGAIMPMHVDRDSVAYDWIPQ